MMKNLILLFCLLTASIGSISAQAPSYTDFEWDIIGLGTSIPTGSNELSTGLAYGGEVRFNMTDYLSIGIGTDISLFDFKNLENLEEEDVTLGFSNTSYLSCDYYFKTNSSKRGFAGLAIGNTDIGDLEFKENGDEPTIIEGVNGMSLSPRVGFEYGHARFQLHYNIGMKKELTDYIAFKLSLTLWGGYNG